jgi:hypothetical protein
MTLLLTGSSSCAAAYLFPTLLRYIHVFSYRTVCYAKLHARSQVASSLSSTVDSWAIGWDALDCSLKTPQHTAGRILRQEFAQYQHDGDTCRCTYSTRKQNGCEHHQPTSGRSCASVRRMSAFGFQTAYRSTSQHQSRCRCP